MILTLDVGNSHIFGGVVSGVDILIQFRKSSRIGITSDELGVFLRSILRENKISPDSIRHIAICSVVPDLIHTLTNTCLKYFTMSPFILSSDMITGLEIKYKNPQELGADRIANAIAGTHLYPNRHLIIVDFGTANTLCAISRNREYLGGLILPGMRISMQVLSSETAKLPTVEIKPPSKLMGQSTVESIQSGLYYGNLVMIREVCRLIKAEYFNNEELMVIGTGGFVRLFENENLFDTVIPDLVLIGLHKAIELNVLTSVVKT